MTHIAGYRNNFDVEGHVRIGDYPRGRGFSLDIDIGRHRRHDYHRRGDYHRARDYGAPRGAGTALPAAILTRGLATSPHRDVGRRDMTHMFHSFTRAVDHPVMGAHLTEAWANDRRDYRPGSLVRLSDELAHVTRSNVAGAILTSAHVQSRAPIRDVVRAWQIMRGEVTNDAVAAAHLAAAAAQSRGSVSIGDIAHTYRQFNRSDGVGSRAAAKLTQAWATSNRSRDHIYDTYRSFDRRAGVTSDAAAELTIAWAAGRGYPSTRSIRNTYEHMRDDMSGRRRY